MASGRPSWIGLKTDEFLDELDKFGLVVARERVAVDLNEKVAAVALALGISEKSAGTYITEEVVRDLARRAAILLAEEQPGADLFAQPRNIVLPVAVAGRVIAALAETARTRRSAADLEGLETALLNLSHFGQFLSRYPLIADEGVALPQALLTRSARLFEATSEMLRSEQPPVLDDGASADELADGFARDALVLRCFVRDYGRPAGAPDP